MASLHFIYSTMNSGKTTTLLQADFNYRERKMETLLLKPKVDNRDGDQIIKSRIGLQAECVTFDENENLYDLIKNLPRVACVLVDEAQFITEKQVDELSDVVDLLGTPVMCFGLRTDFQGKVFPGSGRLLAIADKLEESKGICFCGKKARFVLRTDENGTVINEGPQVDIGGNDKYIAVCRKHFKLKMYM